MTVSDRSSYSSRDSENRTNRTNRENRADLYSSTAEGGGKIDISPPDKVVHLIPLNFKVSAAETVARLFVDHGWRIHGMLVKLYGDQDSRFISAFWKEVAHLTGMMSPGSSRSPSLSPTPTRRHEPSWTSGNGSFARHRSTCDAQDGSFEQYAAHTRPPEIYTSADLVMLSSKVNAAPGHCGTKWKLRNLLPTVESAWMEPTSRAADVRIRSDLHTYRCTGEQIWVDLQACRCADVPMWGDLPRYAHVQDTQMCTDVEMCVLLHKVNDMRAQDWSGPSLPIRVLGLFSGTGSVDKHLLTWSLYRYVESASVYPIPERLVKSLAEEMKRKVTVDPLPVCMIMSITEEMDSLEDTDVGTDWLHFGDGLKHYGVPTYES
jgi:hypothetical protein